VMMISISVGDLQRNLNTTVLPYVKSGETIEVIDKKTGEVKFHIIAAVQEERKMNWPNFTGNMVIPSGDTKDPVADALEHVRGDREL